MISPFGHKFYQISETISRLLDREFCHLYKPRLYFWRGSDPHSVTLVEECRLAGKWFRVVIEREVRHGHRSAHLSCR